MSTPSLALPLEVMTIIGSYLNLSSLASCTQVCTTWHRVFISQLWSTFDDIRFPKLQTCSQSSQPTGNPCQEEIELTALFNKFGHHIQHLTIRHILTLTVCLATAVKTANLISINLQCDRPHIPVSRLLQPATENSSSKIIADTVNKYGHLFPNNYLRECLSGHTRTYSKLCVRIALPPKTRSILRLEGNWMIEAERHYFRQSQQFWYLVSLNRTSLQQLHFGDNVKMLQLTMSLDYFYTGLIAPLLCLTAITLPIPGIDMGRLKQAAPRLQKICLSGSEAGVASYYQSPPAEQTKEGSDQDVNGDLNSAESISRSRPMTVSMFPSSPFSLQRLDVDAVLDCSTLCYILSNIPTIQHLSLLGFHTFLPDSPEHNTRFPELIEQYGSCFKAITELRCMASILFFDRDLQTVLPYMPQLRQLSIPQIFQESTTFKVLHESCPHLEAVHLINHWNGLSQVEFQRQGFFELMLREMPQLKTMDYNGVFIDASLFGKDAENNDKEDIADWTCVDLEQLRCQITGMVRLTEEEKETYKVLVRRGGHTAPAAAEDTGNRLKQERTVLEKINRKTLQERELYRRFARLRRVRVVDFGFRVFGSPRGGPGEHGWITTSNVARKCNSLELSMTSGLEKLLEAWKGSLEEIGFSTEGQTGIGAIEVLSMVEHWPRLERVKVCVFPGEETKWRHIRELVRKKRSSVHVEIAVRELRDDTVEMEMILNQREWRMT